jgi:hypothetical protein
LFQNIAVANSEDLGYDQPKMSPKGLFWVTSKQKIRVTERPMQGEYVELTTWPEKPDRIYKALEKHNLRYARICKRKKDFDLPAKWLEWTPNGHHKMGLSICKRYLNFKPEKMSVCYIGGHSYEFAIPSPCWEVIENICKLIANKPDIWYATNWEIARYVQACEAAEKASKFPEIVNPTAETLYLLFDGKQITLAPNSKTTLK